MAILRAALSKVLSPGAPNSEAAWQEALKVYPERQWPAARSILTAQQRKEAARQQ